tara:strand:- start:83 stop:796 length:714 start_codon:yes stop_codon:yes gene_type:complete
MAINQGQFEKMNTGIMDPNLMRLYNPQQFMATFPQMPIIAAPPLPPVPFQPKETPGGNRPDNFVSPEFNPNLLGQYVGYYNPAFSAAPGGTGSPQEINNLMSSKAPTSIVGNELPFTPIGTNIQQDDEEEFGIMKLLQLSPTFKFFTQAVPEIIGNVAEGIQKAFQQQEGGSGDGGGGSGNNKPDTTGGFQFDDAGGYQQGPGGQGGAPKTTGGASKQKQKENQALGKSRGFNFGGR